ncbi:MAG: serine aminopeptidase domain-containing protein, partial [Nitrospirales bacterium]
MNISLPAQLEHVKSGPGWPRSGHLCNLSVTGACMTISGSIEKFEPEVLIRLTVPVSLHAKTSTSPGPKAEYALRGTVVWVRPDHSSSAWTKEGGRASSVRVGIWFRPGQEEDRGRLATLVGSMMASPMRMAGRSEKTSILTALLDCNTAEGKRLSLCHDFPRDPLAPGSPVAVIVPNFGETKRHYIALAYYLAANGYQVLRYDHPDHPGESEGSALKPTLTGFSQALRTVLEFAERQWPVSPLTVIAAGMSGRVAVKTLPSFKKVRLLVLLNGVFDVQASLLNAHQEDLLQMFTEGTRRGVTNILGQNIDSDLFLDDAIRGGFANFQTTLRDAEQLKTEIALFSPKEGLWVNREHLHQLQQALRSSPIQWFVYPDDLPHSMEYPEQNRAMLRQTVDCVTERLYPLASASQVREPSWQIILQQQQLESGRIRALHWLSRARMRSFWADYLNHFDQFVNFPDYWKMLDDAHRALQLNGEHKFLDAGCGNGNFGLFLMVTESYASRQKTPGLPPRYIGLDFV